MIRVEHRESLAYALSEAAELEHGLMCCYLYTAFSIGRRCERRYPAEQAAAIARWRAEITDIARDEMAHLALVSNLLNAVGAAPHLLRPNFPVTPGYHPAGIRVSLAPFSLATIQHFVYLERPDDVIEREGEGFAGRSYARIGHAGRLVPSGQDYATLGDLYRWIRDGFGHLVDVHGEAGVFCGDPRLQVTSSEVGLPGVIAVVDLASAARAVSVLDVANAISAFTLRSIGVLYSPVALAGDVRALAIEAIMSGMRALTPTAELLTELPASSGDPTT